MCQFKSGLILKDRIVIAPMVNDSHSEMLDKLKIKDDYFGASHIFVRAELIPPDGDKTRDVQDWEFVVDQDIVPDWFDADREKYECKFREEVKNWMKSNIFIFVGRPWTKIKTDEKGTYYLLADILEISSFGYNNDYDESEIRTRLASSELLKSLIDRFGSKIIPTNNGDLLSIPSSALYWESSERIPPTDRWWTSTPLSGTSYFVQYVSGGGLVGCCGCGYTKGVRPFFILKD